MSLILNNNKYVCGITRKPLIIIESEKLIEKGFTAKISNKKHNIIKLKCRYCKKEHEMEKHAYLQLLSNFWDVNLI